MKETASQVRLDPDVRRSFDSDSASRQNLVDGTTSGSRTRPHDDGHPPAHPYSPTIIGHVTRLRFNNDDHDDYSTPPTNPLPAGRCCTCHSSRGLAR